MNTTVLAKPVAEPSPQAIPAGPRRLFLATRPAFLSVTLVAVFIGLATAWAGGSGIDASRAVATLLFALIAHAGANVINDYHDMATDAVNIERLFPFTGGSRFIQNGVLTPTSTARLGYGLLLAVIPAGLWLTATSGSGLLLIGLAGLLVGWAYSAPPLRLAARGLGETGIVAGWLLVVIGTDYVQRHHFATLPLAAGLGYALMVANVLYINQFPDAVADGAAGKHTLVARIGRRAARWGYPLIALLAAVSLLAGIALAVLPAPTFLALLGLVPAMAATRALWPHAEQPAQLLPAIKLTLLAVHLYGVLLIAALVYSGVHS